MKLGSMSHGIKGLLTALDGGVYRMGIGLVKGRSGGDSLRLDMPSFTHRTDQEDVLDVLYYTKSRELELTARVGLRAFVEALCAGHLAAADQAGVTLC